MERVYAPDILPNMFRAIREGRNLTLKQVADEIVIDRNFLAAVELVNNNFSSKTTIRALRYYDINFYKPFNIKEKVELPCSDFFPEKFSEKLVLPVSEITDILTSYDINTNNDESFLSDDKIVDLLREKKDIINNKIKNDFMKKNIDINVFESKVKSINKGNNGEWIVDVDADVEIFQTKTLTFDINFIRDENYELTEKLLNRGFQETITTIDLEIDNENIFFNGDKLILDKEYKLPIKDDPGAFVLKKELLISDDIKVKYNTENMPVEVSFKCYRPEINSLKFIRTELGISIEDIHTALGMTYYGYINLELGNQKISTKKMWRLVKMLNLPLEVIINIDEYYERFCKKTKKIEKKSLVIESED